MLSPQRRLDHSRRHALRALVEILDFVQRADRADSSARFSHLRRDRLMTRKNPVSEAHCFTFSQCSSSRFSPIQREVLACETLQLADAHSPLASFVEILANRVVSFLSLSSTSRTLSLRFRCHSRCLRITRLHAPAHIIVKPLAREVRNSLLALCQRRLHFVIRSRRTQRLRHHLKSQHRVRRGPVSSRDQFAIEPALGRVFGGGVEGHGASRRS